MTILERVQQMLEGVNKQLETATGSEKERLELKKSQLEAYIRVKSA